MYNKQKLNALLVFLYMKEYGTETAESMLVSDLIFAIEHSEFYKKKPIDELTKEYIRKKELESILVSMMGEYIDTQGNRCDEELISDLKRLL